MAVTEAGIILPNGAGEERVLKDTVTNRLMEVVAHVNSNGDLVSPNPLSEYELTDLTNDAVNPQYHGFLKADGSWAIKQIDMSADPRTIRWAVGTSGYAANFAGRAGLSYDYFDAVF